MYSTPKRLQLMLSVTNFKLLALLALSCACGWSIWMQYQQANEIATYRQQLEVLTSRLTLVDSAIQQQTAALRRVLGNVFPVEMPSEWENRLKDLEVQVADVSRWPKDTGEAGRFLDQTSELVQGIPIWAEAHYLPRLSSVRWTAMAFISLHPSRDTTASLDHRAEEMRTLADTKPEGGSTELEQRLRKHASVLAGNAEQIRVAAAMEQAQQYLTTNANAGTEPTDAQLDILSVYEFLEAYETHRDLGSNVVTLRKKLHERMMMRQAERQAAMLKTRWSAMQKLQTTQPTVYQASVNMLLGDVMSARVALAIESIEQPIYDELERDLHRAAMAVATQTAKSEEERQARAIRGYQRWALMEIKLFENAFQAVSNKAGEEASIWKYGRGEWRDASYQEVRDRMLTHLLPINFGLLDLPVQERYQRAFQHGWKTLDGRQEQTEVAEQAAVIVKQSLRTFLEDV